MQKEAVFIIHTLNSYGGTQRHITMIANKMAEKGHPVTVISLNDKTPYYPLHPSITNYDLHELCDLPFGFRVRRGFYRLVRRRVHNRIIRPIAALFNRRLPASIYTKTEYYYGYAWQLRRFLERHREAAFFAVSPNTAIALSVAAEGLDVKTVYCEMSTPVITAWPEELIQLRNRSVSRFSCAIFQTEEEKAYYSGIFSGSQFVIPNPIMQDLPAPYVGRRSDRIVNFCRIDRQKNLPLLIEAFALIHKKHPSYRLEIYGKGAGRDEEAVFSLIRQLQLEQSAVVLPFCSDVHQRIRDAAMFVSTADYEGISNSMLEAMAIGLPCVCTDCDGGGAREMIRDGENGLLVPKGDQIAVAEAMERLLSEPAFAASLGRNAAKIRETLDAETIADQWIHASLSSDDFSHGTLQAVQEASWRQG